jgi:hypothetical protein
MLKVNRNISLSDDFISLLAAKFPHHQNAEYAQLKTVPTVVFIERIESASKMKAMKLGYTLVEFDRSEQVGTLFWNAGFHIAIDCGDVMSIQQNSHLILEYFDGTVYLLENSDPNINGRLR